MPSSHKEAEHIWNLILKNLSVINWKTINYAYLVAKTGFEPVTFGLWTENELISFSFYIENQSLTKLKKSDLYSVIVFLFFMYILDLQYFIE